MASRRPQGPLRRGWTTGACAAAAAKAAYQALLTGAFPDPVTLRLPKGETPTFSLSRNKIDGGHAVAAIIKDAGDDPDVTHGAEIVVDVALGTPGTGVTFHAGSGVGTVTRPGLPLAVGEPAINPMPRKMIAAAIDEVAVACGGSGDVAVTVAIPGGETLALKTSNGRLGIVGGLSILGTTGVVIPYSCASWIASIQRGVDVARAAGLTHLVAATGRTSEEAACRLTGVEETALIDMGDFAGGLLKYLRQRPVARLTIAGGFAKLAKLAQGHLDLHSARSQLDMLRLASLLEDLGADADIVNRARQSRTALGVLQIAGDFGPRLASLTATRARETARATLSGETAIDILVFDREGKLIGHAGD